MTQFHELYDRYSRDVYRFALYLSGDPALADDIASETFIKLWSSPEPVRFATVKAYLLTIARNLWLIDELLTPDSSRYWPAASYAPNQSPPSYDKQFVRDHLVAIKWDQNPPAPRLPAEVIARTQEKYLAALKNLIGG